MLSPEGDELEEEEHFQERDDQEEEEAEVRRCCGACLPARQKPLAPGAPRQNEWGEELDEYGEVLVRKDGGMYPFVPLEVYGLSVIATVAIICVGWLTWLAGMEMFVPVGLMINAVDNLVGQVNQFTNNVAQAPATSRYTVKMAQPVFQS